MRTIKLMPDYGCYPLWEASQDAPGNIDPDTLPISADLKARLRKWAAQYDATLNSSDPLQSGFPSEDDERQFKEIGQQIRVNLQEELGRDYELILKI